jgi:hypothetical protein
VIFDIIFGKGVGKKENNGLEERNCMQGNTGKKEEKVNVKSEKQDGLVVNCCAGRECAGNGMPATATTC